MSKLFKLSKSGVTVIKPEFKIAEFKRKGFVVEGEIDEVTGKLKGAQAPEKPATTNTSANTGKD